MKRGSVTKTGHGHVRRILVEAAQHDRHQPVRSQAIRVAIFLIASLRAHGLTQTKVSIGLGTIELLHESRTSLSFGEAFVLSGHGLDAMKKSILRLDLPSSAGLVEIITFASTPPAPAHGQIADKLEVRQQSVNSSLPASETRATLLIVVPQTFSFLIFEFYLWCCSLRLDTG